MSLPPPVYAQETPLSGLNTAELLLVMTLRLWAARHDHPSEPCPDWRSGLAASGIDVSGISGFGGLVGVIAAALRHPLDVRCSHCPSLGDDEARLLQIVSLLQRHQAQNAGAILAEWIPLAAVRIAVAAVQALADALAQSGLIVPARCPTAVRLKMGPQSVHANPGLALVQ